MRIVYTFYDYVLIQKQSYDHASNNTCLFTYKSPLMVMMMCTDQNKL